MLSLIMPGIRPHNWARVYDSISKSTKRDFELIIISPYELPAELKDKPNIKFIQDWGNPTRCQQLGLLQSEGEVIGAHADDAFYYPDKLDIVLDEFYDTIHPKKSIGAKYLEGDGTSEKVHQTDDYYRLNGSQWTSSPLFSDEWMLFNIIFMNREYLMKLGGWDCQFETTFYGHTDLAVRAQNDGAPVTLLDLDLTDAGYMPERTGDHAPIHNAHVEHDYPLFKSIYSKGPIQSFISIDNWKLAPEKWPRRFK